MYIQLAPKNVEPTRRRRSSPHGSETPSTTTPNHLSAATRHSQMSERMEAVEGSVGQRVQIVVA